MQRPALIFDFGNVIAFFDFTRATMRLGEILGHPGDRLHDRLAVAGWNSIHRAYEHGQLRSAEFAALWLDLLGVQAEFSVFEEAWTNIFRPNESICPIIDSLHQQGYSLILGSNTNALHASYLQREYRSVLNQFQALIFSNEIGQMKPSPDFYQACAKAAHRKTQECIMIDDLEANIAGAKRVGMQGVVYSTTPQLRLSLAELGVVV